MKLTKEQRAILAKIGSIGGKKSKRKITPNQQAKMQEARKKLSVLRGGRTNGKKRD
jgi:hypothetical protein